jgi:GntR family transcriptional regulator
MDPSNFHLFANISSQIDRRSPVPLYYQISEAILEIIKKERLEPYTKIPPEEYLCKTLNVSKMTLRQALGKLVSDGMLERRQGSGTFVAQRKIQRKATKLVSFFDDTRDKGLVLTSRVLEQAIIRPNRQVIRQLQLGAREKVLRIIRIRFTNKLPLVVNYAHVPQRLCPNLLQENLERISLSKLLEERFQISPEYAVQNLQAVRATANDAAFLEIKEGDPLLHMERTMFNHDHLPVSYYVSLFRGDKYIFSSTLYR